VFGDLDDIDNNVQIIGIQVRLVDLCYITLLRCAIIPGLTSPDSPKAKYWGHMPETFTSSAGVIQSRFLKTHLCVLF
ncbi:DUF823 domain-containing adhesin, partial [Escherichia coli]|nr:DUF823 domain-containing adhesin [Escherichia coli]